MTIKNRIERSGMAKLSEILFNPMNWRVHPKQQYEALLGEVEEIGWVQEVIINETTGNLVDGHLRCKLAERAGETEIPAKWIKVSEQEEKTILATLDPIGAMAGTDRNKLDQLLKGVDIKNAAMQEMLAKMAAKNGLYNDEDDDDDEITEDKTEALRAKWATELGQLWQLGAHRLLCGDSTDPANWKLLMRNEQATMVFTDPPYGVDYAATKRNNPAYRDDKDFYKIAGDDLKDNKLVALLKGALTMAMENSIDDAAFYIWHGATTRRDFEYVLDVIGLEEKQYIVWIKDSFSPGWTDYQYQTEPCFYAQKYGAKVEFYGDRGQSTIWQVRRVSGETAAITIANGLKISDGEHQPLYLTVRPNTQKQRHIRLNRDQSIEITMPGESDAWQFARKEKGEDWYHPTQKPTALSEIAIRNSSLPDQIVIDPFLGGGCTLLGAEKTRRSCYGMELDPKWIAAILERWTRRTGLMPTLLNPPKPDDKK